MTPVHLIFVMVVALLIFGPKRVPEIGRELGRGVREFRVGLQDGEKTGSEGDQNNPED